MIYCLSRDMSWSLLECYDNVCVSNAETRDIPNIVAIVGSLLSLLLLSFIALRDK